jgi:hypothetical protein
MPEPAIALAVAFAFGLVPPCQMPLVLSLSKKYYKNRARVLEHWN